MTKLTFYSQNCFRATLFLLVSGLFAPVARGQSLDDVVVSAFAEMQSPGNGTLCWTLGELMVEFYSNGAALDQGFLQGCLMVSDVTDEPTDDLKISIYPNPTSAILNIRTATAGSYSAELSDIHGRRLITHSFAGESTELDLSAWPSGAYLLRIISEGKTVNTSIIQKIR